MENRKARRNQKNTNKLKAGAKRQLIIMLLSIALMFFSLSQVYYLTKYTLGQNVSSEKLKVYRWIRLLLEGTDSIHQ